MNKALVVCAIVTVALNTVVATCAILTLAFMFSQT
jgi:hypothetical protein